MMLALLLLFSDPLGAYACLTFYSTDLGVIVFTLMLVSHVHRMTFVAPGIKITFKAGRSSSLHLFLSSEKQKLPPNSLEGFYL